MSNYRQYSRYRQHYQPGHRLVKTAGWVAVIIVLGFLVKNVFSGHSDSKNMNTNAEVALADDANSNVNGSSSGPTIEGRDLMVGDCAQPISRKTTDQPYVSLTLDGNGIVGNASAVLNKLKEKNVPATLFASGAWANDALMGDDSKTRVVTAFHDAGYDVFNHSNTHASFKTLAKATADEELLKADQTISALTGTSTKPFFRPPFGDYDQASLTEARNQGYCMILWTVDSLDWKTGITVDEAIANVTVGLKNGAIIVLQANSDIGKDLIAPLVDAVRAEGYTFVSLKNLLRQTGAATTYTNTNASAATNATTNTNKTTTNKNSNTNTTTTNTNKSTNTNVNTNKNTTVKNTNANT